MNLLGTHAKNGPRPDYREALLDSLVKLNPLYLWKDSPVMLVVEAGFALVLAMGFAPGAFAGLVNQSRWFYFVVAEAGKSYLDQMISLVENAKRPKSASEVSLTILLVGLTAIFVVVCSACLCLADYLGLLIDLAILISLLVALMPTTIGGLLPAIGVAGIARVGEANVVAKSGKAVEAAGDVDILILDKTGTITEGQRTVKEFVPLKGYTKDEVGQAAYLASIYDQTPEGRSIIEVSKENGWVLPLTPRILAGKSIDFSAESRVSGVELFVPRPGTLGIQELPTAPPEAAESRIWRLLLDLEVSARPAKVLKGAVDAILDLSPEVNEAELLWQAQEISKTGGTPIAVAVDRLVVGLINLRDNLKPHIREKLDAVRATGIKTVMVTGDAELTARVIAQEAGIDEVMAGAKPADKLVRVELEQKRGHVVGVEGDGTNDAPALAKADVGIAMNSGTSAAREAANMVDLDSDPAKILKVVEVGKQLLMTRGAITTFSVTNDIAKYFTLFPAVIPMLAYPLCVLGIGQLAFPGQSNGSVMMCNGKAVGSTLIGQNVTSPMLFHPRPSNESASGVDPHIRPEAAYAQIPRINSTTDIDARFIRLLVEKNLDANRASNAGVLAPDYVNVNELNLDLIQRFPEKYPGFCA